MARAALLLVIGGIANSASADPNEGLEERLAGKPSPRRTFLDAMVVEESENLRRVFHTAKKHPANPVMVGESPWEGWGPYLYGTVLKVDGGLRMWYSCIGDGSGFVCYAESDDGIHWRKPDLNLNEYRGSTENNIVAPIGMPSVMKMRDSTSERRNWAMFSWEGNEGATVRFSKDGIHWPKSPRKSDLFSTSDVVNFFYDAYHERFVSTYKTAGRRHRSVGIAVSQDGLQWKKPVNGAVFTADDLDPDATQVYGMPVFPYQGMYIGLPWIYHARFFKFGEYTVDRLHEAQMDSPRTVDVQLAWSWDLINWTRTPQREPIIPLGPEGAWDDGMIFTARAPVIVDDKLYFYYGGFDQVHDNYKGIKGAVGLATLRLDGFCSVQAGQEEGSLISRREVFKTPEIVINARTESDGYVVAELLNKENEVIAGFSRDDCKAFQGDAIRHCLTWGEEAFREEVVDQVKKIRFYMKSANLYSYRPVDIDTARDQGNREPK